MRGRGTYAGLAGIARGAIGGGAGFVEGDGAADAAEPSGVVEVNEAPQYRQNRDVSLFIVPHASQRIEGSRAQYQTRGFELWVVTDRCYRKRK